MTDEAMTMAAEPAAMPETVQTEAPSVEIDRSAEVTPRNSIERAFDTVDKMAVEPQQEQEAAPSAEMQDGQPRTPDGKFAKRDGEESEDQAQVEAQPEAELTDFVEAPNRFSSDAKAAWKDAPGPVRAEITRAIGELEKGITEYQQAYEPFKDFAKDVSANGQDPAQVLGFYTNMEALISQNPIQGLDAIIGNLQNAGLLQVGTLRELASAMSGQTPDQNAVMQDQTIRELRHELASLKQELGGVSTTIKSQSEAATLKEIEAFASQPEHSRFEELTTDIAFFLKNGRAKTLQDAYSLAERLNPAPQAAAPAQPAAAAAEQTAPAQPRKGGLSVTGAPSSGSNPANRQPASTARESLKNAFAQVGL
jgi:hypothetical protein